MTSSAHKASSISRRIIWLAVAIVVVIAAYIAGWYYVADRLHSTATQQLRAMRAAGTEADCVNQTVQGFPFRLGLFCDNVLYASASGDVRVKAGAFRSAAQVYDPRTVVGELDGPMEAHLPGLVPLTASWGLMHASARIAQPLPSAISVEGRDVTVAEGIGGTGLFTAENAQMHMRALEKDVDIATRFTGLRLTNVRGAENAPPLNVEGTMTVFDGVALATARNAAEIGYKTNIRNLTLSVADEASIGLSGPLAVDASGLIDAELTLTARRPEAIARVLNAFFPNNQREIQMVASGLTMLGNAPSLPLSISKGRARIAFVTLGDIPPLRP